MAGARGLGRLGIDCQGTNVMRKNGIKQNEHSSTTHLDTSRVQG
jgi:hypothetical protein